MNDIVLIGQGTTAAAAIESLVARHRVAALIRNVQAPEDPVAVFAARHAIPVLGDVTPSGIRAALLKIGPECVVISSHNRIIQRDMLERFPFVNVHYGPLPRYRGRANVNWSIINREIEAAITVHCVDPGLDSGNILFQEFIEVGPEDSVTEVYERLNEIQRRELGAVVERFLAGDRGRAQEGAATYCCTRVPGDGEIDWTAPTASIYALIRALAEPYDGAFTFLRLQRLRILRAAPVVDAPAYIGRIPGRICAIDRESGAVDVLSGDGVLRIYEVEDSRGVRLPAVGAITSTRDTLGLDAKDVLASVEQLRETMGRLLAAVERIERV